MTKDRRRVQALQLIFAFHLPITLKARVPVLDDGIGDEMITSA